ncbi:MAG TPA: APC family permease [Allosphingosinicella sp.]|uniref:APC family permease n=1 Tax=Allosphingosinicella sp. TaxID=2823234 RepID=UPI002EDB9168
MTNQENQAANDEGLRRDIGFWGSAFLAFNGVVGAGIFALPETLYAQFGTFSPWLFPLFGGLILLIAVPFGKVAAHYPTSGGPVLYAAPYGPIVSFQAGWLYYVARVTALAANANVFMTYAASLWPAVGEGIGRAIGIAALCALLAFINIVGVKRAIRTLDALTLLKATPLIFMALWGIILSVGSVSFPSSLPPLSEVEVAALLTLYAFVGFENSVVPAGETANPQRTIPRGIVLTLLATVTLYFIVQLAYVGVMTPGAGGDAPLVTFGSVVAGPVGALLLTAAALFSIGGNLFATTTSTSRVTFALARDGMLPRWFSRVNESYQTPANSIIFIGAVGALLAISGSFVWLAVVSTLSRLFVYGITISRLPSLRREQGRAAHLFAHLWAGAGLIVCIWAALQSEWPAWRMLLVLTGVGLLLYALARRRRAQAA